MQILLTIAFHFTLYLLTVLCNLSGLEKMTHFNVTVKLVNMPFNKDRILIKNVYLTKGYVA